MWSTRLHTAAKRFDGGCRSFPPTVDASLAINHTYEPPNEDYERLFYSQVTRSSSRVSALGIGHSAGWLFPDEQSICNPVFVAHSILSAVWLLRATLGKAALPDLGWERLVAAAEEMAGGGSAGEGSQAGEGVEEVSSGQAHSAAKRTASPTAPPSPEKRARHYDGQALSPAYGTPFDETEVQVDGSQQSEGGPPREAAPPLHTVRVTSNNRAAEKKRVQKRKEAEEERRRVAGLQAPQPAAPRKEHGAYASITAPDEPLVAWIIKQRLGKDSDFFSSVGAPYATAVGMLDRARAVGNQTSKRAAAAFLQSWRSLGSPFALEEPAQASLARTPPQLLSQGHGPGLLRGATSSAWQLCNRFELELGVMHIKYRWSLAFLGQRYAALVEEIRASDQASGRGGSANRHGLGKVSTQAQQALLRESGIEPDPTLAPLVRSRLHRAKRWFKAAEQLGWGMLCFIPHDVVTDSWVENELRIEVWYTWLELVEKINPTAVSASRAMGSWLGAEVGGSISDKETLELEMGPAEASTQVEEVPDSEEEGGELESGEDLDGEASSPPAQAWRQRTLLELCQPPA